MQAWLKDLQSSVIKQRVTKMFLDWISIGFFFDFQHDPKLVKRLHTVLESLLPATEHNKLKLMLLKGKVDPHGLDFPDDTDTIKKDSAGAVELLTGLQFFFQRDVPSIAQEMSFIDYELYHSIEASELMNKNWQRENAKELSPNLVALRKRFNQVSFWALSIILKASDSKQQQVKVVKQLLDLAWQLYQMRSYNSMGAIVSALQNVSITRLHYIWEGLSKADQKHRDELNNVLDVTNNFKVYRGQLEEAAKSEQPCIPYIPLHLRDMLTIYEREENHLTGLDDEGKQLVNYEKMVALGQTMHTILQFRGVQWKGTQDVAMREFLLKLPFYSEDDLLESSDHWKAHGVQGESGVGPADGAGGTIPQGMRAAMVDKTVAIALAFDMMVVVFPFLVTAGFKELKKQVKSIYGKDCELYFQTQSGLSIHLASQAEMSSFLTSSPELRLDAIHSRTVRMTSRSARGSLNATMRGRPNSALLAAAAAAAEKEASAAQQAGGPKSPTMSVPDSFDSKPSLSRRRSLSSVGMMPSANNAAVSLTMSSPDGVPVLHAPISTGSSPLLSPALSPSLSPRGDEKKRLLHVEIVLDNSTDAPSDLVVPLGIAFEDFSLLLNILLGFQVDVFQMDSSNKGSPKSRAANIISDDGAWQKLAKSSKDTKLPLLLKKSMNDLKSAAASLDGLM